MPTALDWELGATVADDDALVLLLLPQPATTNAAVASAPMILVLINTSPG